MGQKKSILSEFKMGVWPRKIETAGYESGYETLYYKSPDALVLGFIKNNYLPIVQAIRDGDLVNPVVAGLPVEEVFIRWLDARSTDQILYLGYHQALTQGDWSAFSCAQFTANRLAYQHDTRAYLQNWSSFDGPWGTGYDRCSFATRRSTPLRRATLRWPRLICLGRMA